MSFFRVFIASLVIASSAFAGKIITYTASSRESQEDANNAAMAGVAKQVSAQIKVNQTLDKEEVSVGQKSQMTESYKSNSKVLSDIKIKGITVTPQPAEKGFKATATLDLDEFTADIQFKMKAIQTEIAKYEEQVQMALKERRYASAVEAIQNAEPLPKKYKTLISELGKVYPINESHQLKQNLSLLKDDIIRQLSGIKITGPSQSFVLTKPEMPAFDIFVTDKEGPVENFPLTALQGRNSLALASTSAEGSANMKLRDINIQRGPYVIVIEPNLPEEYLSAAGLKNKMEIEFKVTQTRCAVSVSCNEDQSICSQLGKSLAKKGIFLEDSDNVPSLDLTITVQAGNSIEYVPGKYTTPYDVDLTLKNRDINFMASGHDNGKKEKDAVLSVIKKIKFDSLKKQLEPYCK